MAIHRWHLFSEAACEELKKDFRTDELHEIRKHFDASSFRTNRNDLTALGQDILQCQNIRELLAFSRGGQLDSDTAFKKRKLAHVLEDILNIKRRQYRKYAHKTESRHPWRPAPELPPNWADQHRGGILGPGQKKMTTPPTRRPATTPMTASSQKSLPASKPRIHWQKFSASRNC